MRRTKPTTPEQVAARCVAELLAAIRRTGRQQLRHGQTVAGLRVTIAVRPARVPTEDSAVDLPLSLLDAPPSVRRVFRALRDLRAKHGPGATVTARHIFAHLLTSDPSGDEPSKDTINHALADLRKRSLAWSHPERRWALTENHEAH